MNLGKAAASLVVAGVLGAQVAAITPWFAGGWYWPFTDYPMYSSVRYPGSTFGIYDLTLTDCSGAARPVTAFDLGMSDFVFRSALETVSGGRVDLPRTPEQAAERRAFLETHIALRLPGDWCAAEVRGRIYEMGERGLVTAEPELVRLAEWQIARPAP